MREGGRMCWEAGVGRMVCVGVGHCRTLPRSTSLTVHLRQPAPAKTHRLEILLNIGSYHDWGIVTIIRGRFCTFQGVLLDTLDIIG